MLRCHLNRPVEFSPLFNDKSFLRHQFQLTQSFCFIDSSELSLERKETDQANITKTTKCIYLHLFVASLTTLCIRHEDNLRQVDSLTRPEGVHRPGIDE